jgi:hypothetical protein
MVKTLTRLDKLRALRRVFKQRGMLVGTIADYMAWQFAGALPPVLPWNGSIADIINTSGNGCNGSKDGGDVEPVSDPRSETQIWLAARHRMFEICLKACANTPLQ